MERLILELHDWRTMEPDDDHELIVLFHFSLMPEEARKQGRRPEHTDCFWTEVKLQRFLAEQPGWRELSTDSKIKAMFCHAQEQIREARRKLRHTELFWTPSGKHNSGPAFDFMGVRFPKASPITIDTTDDPTAPRFMAKKGAGHIGGR